MLEKQIQSIAESGATVVVSGGKFGDMSLHYLNKFGLMGVRLNSKFDVRRLCKTVAATALPKIVRYSSYPERYDHSHHILLGKNVILVIFIAVYFTLGKK